MSPQTLQRQRSITPCITDRDPLPDSSSDKDPGSPRVGEGTPPFFRVPERGGSLRERSHSIGPLSGHPDVITQLKAAYSKKANEENIFTT